MKEATGEANITVITIVLIAIVLGVGSVLVNKLMNNVSEASACASCGGYWSAGRCYVSKGSVATMNYSACK